MSDFWSKALGTAPAAPAAPPAPVPQQSSQPWWQTSFVPSSAPTPTEQPVAQPVPQPSAPVPSKAESARSTDHCPNCMSTNYFRPKGQPNAMIQCYECGYNPRFEQMGGAGIPSDGAPAQPARQVAAAHQGYSGAIIGKA